MMRVLPTELTERMETPEEKKKRIAEWRAKRIAEVEQLKQEEKKQN